MVTNCFQGYNSCVFAYGQTGSGKTYTMLGELAENHAICRHSGLMPRIFDHLLREMRRRTAEPEAGAVCKCECHLSMLEIYNESIMDLLRPEASNLAVREDTAQGVHVEGLSRQRVESGALTLPLRILLLTACLRQLHPRPASRCRQLTGCI